MQIKFYSTLTADFFPNDPTDLGDSYNEFEGIPYTGEELTGYANITAGLITDTACVCGYATIWSEEQRLCAPVIRGNARIYGGISGNVICRGNALILPGTSLVNRTNDCFIFEDDRVSVELAEHKPPTKETRAHDFQR